MINGVVLFQNKILIKSNLLKNLFMLMKINKLQSLLLLYFLILYNFKYLNIIIKLTLIHNQKTFKWTLFFLFLSSKYANNILIYIVLSIRFLRLFILPGIISNDVF